VRAARGRGRAGRQCAWSRAYACVPVFGCARAAYLCARLFVCAPVFLYVCFLGCKRVCVCACVCMYVRAPVKARPPQDSQGRRAHPQLGCTHTFMKRRLKVQAQLFPGGPHLFAGVQAEPQQGHLFRPQRGRGLHGACCSHVGRPCTQAGRQVGSQGSSQAGSAPKKAGKQAVHPGRQASRQAGRQAVSLGSKYKPGEGGRRPSLSRQHSAPRPHTLVWQCTQPDRRTREVSSP